MAEKVEETVKKICAGCGIEFDLPVKRVKHSSNWGRQNWYHEPACYRKKLASRGWGLGEDI